MNIENPEGVDASSYCGEEQYRRLFENTSESVVIAELVVNERNTPVNWVYQDVNQAFEKIAGMPKERILGHRHTEVFGIAEPIDEMLKLYTGVVATSKPSRIEMYFRPSNKYLLISAFPLQGRCFGSTATDITELTMLRKALERSLDETRQERERAAALEGIAEAGISTMKLPDLLATLAERISKALQTHSCTIMILDHDKNNFVTQAAYGEPQEMGYRSKKSYGFTGRINRERRTIYIRDAQIEPSVSPHLKEREVRSLLGTPLVARGKVVGVAYVDMKEIREYRPEEVRLLETMASRAAQAIDNATLYAQVVSAHEDLSEALRLERSFSLLLQRALLPRKPSICEDYRVATYYSPAQTDQEIGGDFYDVFVGAEGKTGIVIGDVSGKGLEAAALAATARSTIHAFAHETDLAAEALTRANAVLYPQQPDIGSFVSIFLAILNRSTGDINYASGGHPPGLIYRHGGDVECLGYGQPPVGLMESIRFEQQICHLDAGDKLIIYTDGISEARHDSEMMGIEGVEDIIRRCGHLTPSDLVDELVSSAREWAHGHMADDVAVVIVERIA